MPEITQEEFDLLEQYKTLGSFEELQTKASDEIVSKAAEITGFRKQVLNRLLKTLPSDYNLLQSDDGVFINTPDGEVELSKFAEEEWADFLPSLKAETQERKQVPYVAQTGTQKETTKKSASKKMANNYIMQQYGWALKTDSVN